MRYVLAMCFVSVCLERLNRYVCTFVFGAARWFSGHVLIFPRTRMTVGKGWSCQNSG